jgi:streptomycin 6-kinase
LNCEERVNTDPVGFARHTAELLDLDGDRLLLWLFARCVVESADWPTLAPIARMVAPR